jgi:hypothetical protein
MMRFVTIVAFFMLIFSGAAFAQPASIGCVDKYVRLQAEELKLGFTKHGMEVYKDANVSMHADEPYPVAVQLNKGVMYQMIFVGNMAAKEVRLELFDGEDKKMGMKETKKDDPNYIIYSFIPEKTDMYLVVLSQRAKNKEMCSSFTILRPAAAQQEQQGTVPSENRYNNPRYINSNGQPKNTNNTQPQNTNPRYVPQNKQQNTNSNSNTNSNPRYVPQNTPQQKTNSNSNTNTNTNTNYNNPRYKSQSK